MPARARSLPHLEVKPVESSMTCEHQGCTTLAAWRISLGKSMFFWCREHTRDYMSNVDVWLSLREAQDSVKRRR